MQLVVEATPVYAESRHDQAVTSSQVNGSWLSVTKVVNLRC